MAIKRSSSETLLSGAGLFALYFLFSGLTACTSLTDPSVARQDEIRASQKELLSGNLSAAVRTTEDLMARFGPSPFLLNQLAVIRDRQGRRGQALRILVHAHRLYPANSSLTLNLASEEIAQNQVREARTTLFPLLLQKAWPTGFRTLMGRIDLARGNLSEASLFLHEAHARHPDNPLVLANLGLLHNRMGLRKKARQDFRNALSRGPGEKLRTRLLQLLASNG